MNDKPSYGSDSAPKLGLVTNSIGEFNDAGKEHSEKNVRALFEALKGEGPDLILNSVSQLAERLNL